MRFKLIFLSLFLLLQCCCSYCYANEDFDWLWKIGKIKYRVNGNENEEGIRKIWIIAKLVEKLAQQYHFTDTILLNYPAKYQFDGSRDEKRFSLFFISYSNNFSENLYRSLPYSSNKKMLAITLFGREMDIEQTLRLAEYAIANSPNIEKNQRTIIYKRKNKENIPVVTIDTLLLKQIAVKNSSETVKQLIAQKTYLPFYLFNYQTSDYSYFYQDKKFFFYNRKHKPEKPLLVLDKIKSFRTFDNKKQALIFENDTNFYFIFKDVVSKKCSIDYSIFKENIDVIEKENNQVLFYSIPYYAYELYLVNHYFLKIYRGTKVCTLIYNINNQTITYESKFDRVEQD